MSLTAFVRQILTFRFALQDFYLPYRMQFLARFALCTLILPGAFALQNSEHSEPVIFPAITSYSLDKAKVNITGELAGQVNLLLISLQPEQQKNVNTWMTLTQ